MSAQSTLIAISVVLVFYFIFAFLANLIWYISRNLPSEPPDGKSPYDTPPADYVKSFMVALFVLGDVIEAIRTPFVRIPLAFIYTPTVWLALIWVGVYWSFGMEGCILSLILCYLAVQFSSRGNINPVHWSLHLQTAYWVVWRWKVVSLTKVSLLCSKN